MLRALGVPVMRLWRRVRRRWEEPGQERKRTDAEIAESREERQRIERQIRALDAELRSRRAR